MPAREISSRPQHLAQRGCTSSDFATALYRSVQAGLVGAHSVDLTWLNSEPGRMHDNSASPHLGGPPHPFRPTVSTAPAAVSCRAMNGIHA